MKYLIFSNQKRMWWRANRLGYTDIVDEAGRYTRDEAEAIVADATVDGQLTHRRVDPFTGDEYSCLDEVMLLAPESTPTDSQPSAVLPRVRELAEKWAGTPHYIPLAQLGRDLLDLLNSAEGGGR